MTAPASKPGPASEPGMVVVVVGPSGAGKDTLMAIAAGHFAGREEVHFVRRIITRESDAGGEDHRSVADHEFEAMAADGAFAVSWEAHGLKYGVPAKVREHLARGELVVVNGSRSVLERFHSAFERIKVVNVTARPEVLAARLEARGRETREDILQRLARGALAVRGEFDVVNIDNSGALDDAGRAMVDALELALKHARGGD
ncbi:phosphonate metabolism protein/1,5-bisphosphokinase (PRPP-forming) PhnN [Rhizobiaceae bacterium n13]|uniref:Ribose 1,5-bisphosphate phosphokinase PhnN n=1 Tax=Ferirhizobium litorale TaxID=2927786 RepID=A0AAE3QIZ6_9HYPH|nr:phosphonate metabolism protein/1,5-bisphosphokinase (PRPP-forming) PhnN [Fererhizobium litorale]MDI7862887.1 phosphonate metabolism protein/1,5-bisphosphokinase (PRPP-forming) PhnN [Fererhizobium litorale]MDI7923973.1 phosphonate metabolism protein/1,5-bisphosphokinase (PRPP-forming) PhnN [Fererhizobium litorale]